jgi:hypothetical protein
MLLATVPQKHIRAIGWNGSKVFFGTGDDGVLYRLGQRNTEKQPRFMKLPRVAAAPLQWQAPVATPLSPATVVEYRQQSTR